MGVRLKNYCSDETRTVCFGQPSEKERDVYHLVKGVQETCLQMVRDGEDYNVIHHYAAQKLGKEMIHTVGHGLGIDVHESPFVNKDGKRVLLQKGMVITIEPGQYHDGKFGVRIEDDVVVEKEKGRVLSKTTKELIVV